MTTHLVSTRTYADRARVLERHLDRAVALHNDLMSDLAPLYPPGDLVSNQIVGLADRYAESLRNCLRVARDESAGVVELRQDEARRMRERRAS